MSEIENNHSLRTYENVLGMLSNEDNPTPMVRLNKVVPFKHAKVYAKLEWYNPFGAVKDRVASNLILDAEEKGLLSEGQKLVEPTSGNTGMGLAMIANARGYSLVTPLSLAIPKEKRTTLRMFGSEVIELSDSLCPAPGAPEGAIARAMDLAAKPDYHMLNQYENPANPEAHFKTTGPEIWRQTGGTVTHFYAGLGTCGTITGNGRFLKSKNKNIKINGIHPAEGHDIPGVRSIRQLTQTKLFFPDEYDSLIEIDNVEAFALCERLNKEESIIAGPSSAMALAGAIKLIPDEPGVVAVVIFPDNVFKYASSIEKHLPHLRAQDAAPAVDAGKELLDNASNPYLTVDVDENRKAAESGDVITVDVRSEAEFKKQHVPSAINVPLEELTYSNKLPKDRSQAIHVICQTGVRSLKGTLTLLSLGYTQSKSVAGGTTGWAEKDYPTVSE
jgi:cysteine synthase/rhodanese-related sulfurtransferase